MIVLTVLDRVSGEFSTPYTFVNIDDAKRRLFQAYAPNPFFKDLEVYSVGTFDNRVGKLLSTDKEFLFTVSALIAELSEGSNV